MTILDSIVSEVRLMFRRPERLQLAALCYRFRKKSATPEMLMITSRDSGRWVIPKGWPMEGKKSHLVAEQEAWEEAGVKGDVNSHSIGFYVYDKGMGNGLTVPCRVQVYPLVVFEMAKRFPEKGTRRLEWVTFPEAADRVAEPTLKALILDYQNRLLSTMNADEQKNIA